MGKHGVNPDKNHNKLLTLTDPGKTVVDCSFWGGRGVSSQSISIMEGESNVRFWCKFSMSVGQDLEILIWQLTLEFFFQVR